MIRLVRKPSHKTCRVFGAVIFGLMASMPLVLSQDENTGLSGEAAAITFGKMPSDQVRSELLSWLASTGEDAVILRRVTEAWADDQVIARLSGEELLDLLVQSFSEADAATKRLVQESYGEGPLATMIYDGIRSTTFFQTHVEQFRARWLVQHRYYDEALPILKSLDPDAVVDPAGLLFYRAICESELLARADALESLSLLLNNTLDVPRRFRVVAEMMQQELAGQQEDGLSQVERLMNDVGRRLELGKSDEDTQKQEDAVIAEIDKLLEDMEKQNQQQQGGGSAGGSQQNQSGGAQGADQSQIKGGPADGIADRKNLKEEGKWGMLDKQAETKARELIRRKLPANFLDQIGRFSRKLAEQQK